MPLALKDRAERARKDIRDPDDFRAPLHAHLEELRVRVFRSLAAVVIGWILGWFLMDPVNKAIMGRGLGAVIEAVPKAKVNVAFTSATAPFLLLLKQSFVLGLCLSMPFVIVQIWGFVSPGLKENEKKPIRTAAPVSILLFFMGVGFCWLILPSAFGWFGAFLSQFPGAILNQDPEQLVTFSVKMMAAFGVCFQLPLIVYVLGRIGILSPETLISNWRQAVVFIFFVAAAITPSSDPASMMMMAVPLCVLYAVSVYAVKLTTKSLPAAKDELQMLD